MLEVFLRNMGDKLYTFSFKEGFKRARKKGGYTQKSFAEEFNISIETVKNWEQGRNVPEIETLEKLCNFFQCDVDYLLGNMQCETHDKQFIQDYTGLSEKSIDVLQTEKYFKSSHCIEIINILLNDLWTHPESRNTKYSFINLFANYLRFCIDGKHKYALSKNGNIKIDPKPDGIDIDGKAMYSTADIHFTSEQLEKMFIMEIEDVLKALKESYTIQKQKASATN